FGSDTREQLGHYPAIGVAVGKLENRGALTSDGVFPNLADLDRCEVGRRVGIGMRHGRTRPPFGTAGCSTGLTAANWPRLPQGGMISRIITVTRGRHVPQVA